MILNSLKNPIFSKNRISYNVHKTAYIIGAYGPSGAGYMAYQLARILHTYFNYHCIVVTRHNEHPDNQVFQYPILFKHINIPEMESRIGINDLLISNPASSQYFFGSRLPGQKIMYVQSFITFGIFDGFFDAYVCVSHFVQQFILRNYGIKAPIIPPFTHPEHLPKPTTWKKRATNKILIMGKRHFKELQALFQETMQKQHSEVPFTLIPIPRYSKNQKALFQLMSTHRYFLQLSPLEGFGLTPLEAMGCGCLALGFHGSGGLDYMHPTGLRRNCATVAYPQMDKLCQNVAFMLSHPKQAEKIATRGTTLIQKYKYHVFEQRWIQFFKNFLY